MKWFESRPARSSRLFGCHHAARLLFAPFVYGSGRV